MRRGRVAANLPRGQYDAEVLVRHIVGAGEIAS
jgi:hypothetical protein